MADLPQYTGVAYAADQFRKEGESIYDFMKRLAALRSQGILGGGGMLNTADGSQVDPTKVSIDPVTNEITDAPLGQVVQQSNDSDSQINGWNKVKTLEQRMAESIARQTQMDGPRAVQGLSLFSGPLAYGAEKLEDWADTQTAKAYLDKVGFTDEYGEKARDAMANNQTAMLSLMSTGDLPAVGGFDRYDMSNYKPQTWGDFGSNVLSDIGDVIGDVGGIIGGLFGSSSATPSATATPAGQYMFDFTPRTGSIDMIGNTPINTMEDLYNLTTVGNSTQGFGNYNPNTGGYTIGTSANRNPDGSYTVGTSYNKNDDGSYTVGTTSGSSPVAATNNDTTSGGIDYSNDTYSVGSLWD